MNRIEIYVDKENKLSIDYYHNVDDDFPMSKFKGEKCYSLISHFCEHPILNIKEDARLEEISLIFKNSILNISECERVFGKKGTGPIKKCIKKYFDTKKKKEFKPQKVKRTNKHVNKEMVTGAIFAAILSATLIGSLISKPVPDPLPPSPTIVYETEAIEETIDDTLYIDEQKDTEIVIDETQYSDPEEELEETIAEEDSIQVFIEYEDKSSTDKAKIAKAYYGDVIEKYAKQYGLDSNIVLAIATQERGIHSPYRDSGGATGLMQIQNSVWDGEEITAYNYELGRFEKITVSAKSLSDVFYNIKIGCMYFQNCLDYMDNNVLAAIQCYNYGFGNMQTVLKEYSSQTGMTREEILADVSNCDWMDCRYVISKNIGDSEYIEHVLSWLGPQINTEVTVDNKPVVLTITNSSPMKQK